MTAKELLDQALGLAPGDTLKVQYPTRQARELARQAMFVAMRKERRQSREAFAPTEDGWDTTRWDGLMICRDGECGIEIVPSESLQPLTVETVHHARS